MKRRIATAPDLGRLLAALVLALGVPAEGTAAVTYTVDRAVAPGRITGTIVTNGKIGPLTVADILDWNLAIDADGNGAATAKLLGPGSGGGASLTFFPQAAITATATGLFFDFSAYGPPPGPPLPPPAPPGPPAIVQFSSPATGGVWQLQGGFFSDELIQESVAPLIQARALRPPAADQIAAAGPPPPLVVMTDTTLTEDRRGSIVIDADDVTLDCAERAVQGEGSGIGIHLESRRGVTVTGCVVAGFAEGIVLEDTSRSTVAGNTVKENLSQGIRLTSSHKNTVSGNSILDNGGGPTGANGLILSASSRNKVEFNTVIGTDASGIPVVDGSASNEFTGNVSSHNGERGFDIIGSSSNTFRRNIAVGNGNGGFDVRDGSRRNTLRENTACLNDPADASEERLGHRSSANNWIQNLFCSPRPD
jgi:parallel beta-helix repeat protein